MIENGLDAKTAVSALLDNEPQFESVNFDIEAGVEDLKCQECGHKGLTPSVIEGEDGEEVPVLHCEKCDTGYIPEAAVAGDEEEGEDEVKEMTIDPDNPVCPECNADALDVHKVEGDDGQEHEVIGCGECGTGFVLTEE